METQSTMVFAEVLQKGRRKLSEFELVIENASRRAIRKDLEDRAHLLWNETLSRASHAGVRVWNGTIYRLENIDAFRAGSSRIHLATVPYAFVSAFPKLCRESALTEEEFPYHVSTATLLRTSDGQFVFGRRHRAFERSPVDLIGGALQPEELEVRTCEDLEHNLFREMREEVNLFPSDVVSSVLLGILKSVTTNVLFIFDVQSNLSATEIQSKFDARTENEFSEQVFVPHTGIHPYLKNQSSYRTLISELLDGR